MTIRLTTVATAALAIILVASPWAVSSSSAHPMEGKPAPNFKLKTLDGKRFSLDKVKADVVVLDFWATWCPPCRKGLPVLQAFNNWAKKNKKSVMVYAVNVGEKTSPVRSYWKKEKFNMHVLMDTSKSAAKSYGVRGIPQTVVIYKGKIASVHVGYSPRLAEILESEVEQLLNSNNDH